MQTVTAHYTHKISPKNTDVSEPFDIADGAFSDRKKLAAALRKQRVLQPGSSIREMRVEGDKVVVFPTASIWHSITLKITNERQKLERELVAAVEGNFWREQVRNKISMEGINLAAVRAAITSEGAEAAAADLCRGCFRA